MALVMDKPAVEVLQQTRDALVREYEFFRTDYVMVDDHMQALDTDTRAGREVYTAMQQRRLADYVIVTHLAGVIEGIDEQHQGSTTALQPLPVLT